MKRSSKGPREIWCHDLTGILGTLSLQGAERVMASYKGLWRKPSKHIPLSRKRSHGSGSWRLIFVCLFSQWLEQDTKIHNLRFLYVLFIFFCFLQRRGPLTSHATTGNLFQVWIFKSYPMPASLCNSHILTCPTGVQRHTGVGEIQV